MTPEAFVYWLQGFFELSGKVESLDPWQIDMIQKHLGYVFDTKQKAQRFVSPTSTRSALGQLSIEDLMLPSSPTAVTC